MTWSSEWCLRNAGQCYSTANAPELRTRPVESEVAQQEDGNDLVRPLDPEPRPPSARLEDESAAPAAAAGVGVVASAVIHLATLPLLFTR